MPNSGNPASRIGKGEQEAAPPAAVVAEAIATAESPKSADWKSLLEKAAQTPESPVQAETLLTPWFNKSAAAPVAMICADKNKYVVKGRNAGRQTVNDRIAAKLATVVGCSAVPPAVLVSISDELKKASPEMAHIATGTAHGSRVMEECTDRLGIQYVDDGDNRTRFARVAIFHGWLFPQDIQFIYTKTAPHTVFSVDHGHCFHTGPAWTVATLALAPPATADKATVNRCNLTFAELAHACQPLVTVTFENIAFAVGSIPADWSLSMQERIVLCEYLEKRRLEMINLYVLSQAPRGS